MAETRIRNGKRQVLKRNRREGGEYRSWQNEVDKADSSGSVGADLSTVSQDFQDSEIPSIANLTKSWSAKDVADFSQDCIDLFEGEFTDKADELIKRAKGEVFIDRDFRSLHNAVDLYQEQLAECAEALEALGRNKDIDPIYTALDRGNDVHNKLLDEIENDYKRDYYPFDEVADRVYVPAQSIDQFEDSFERNLESYELDEDIPIEIYASVRQAMLASSNDWAGNINNLMNVHPGRFFTHSPETNKTIANRYPDAFPEPTLRGIVEYYEDTEELNRALEKIKSNLPADYKPSTNSPELEDFELKYNYVSNKLNKMFSDLTTKSSTEVYEFDPTSNNPSVPKFPKKKQ